MSPDDDGLTDAIARARAVADVSINPADHRLLRALEAAQAARMRPPPVHDPGLVADLPPWSAVSRPGESEPPPL